MPKISFALTEGVGEWTELINDGKRLLRLCFEPQADGYILVGSTVYCVQNGAVSLELSTLADDEYSLRLECEGGGYELEPFIKSGGCIKTSPTCEASLRRIISKSRSAEARLSVIEAELAALKEKAEGHHIFS